MSTVKFGAPFAKGTPLVIEAHAYSIEGAIAGSFFFMPSINFSGVECTSSGLMKTSVEAHQQVTSRETFFVFRKFAMSSFSCSASSYLFFAFFTYVPSSRFTYSRSNAAFIGLIVFRKGLTFPKSSGVNTPAFAAASYASSLKRSQLPKTRSFRSASGTNFLMSGDLPSVRFPSLTVPICVSDPTGCALPFRTSSTPAMNVVLTAPIPGSSTPSFPLAGAIFAGFSILLPQASGRGAAVDFRFYRLVQRAQRPKTIPKQTSSIAQSQGPLQMAEWEEEEDRTVKSMTQSKNGICISTRKRQWNRLHRSEPCPRYSA